MAGLTKLFKDRQGRSLLPVTGSQQVFRRNGKSLEDEMLIKGEQMLATEEQQQVRTNILALGQQDSTVYDIVHLAWATDAATTRKSILSGNRKKGVKISYTNGSGVYIVEQYQSEEVSDTAWADNANWKGCRTPLTPIFEIRGAIFNDETGYYELNEILDITEGEMIKIYKYSVPITYRNAGVFIARFYDSPNGFFYEPHIRTLLPIFIVNETRYDVDFGLGFRQCFYLETLLLGGTLQKPLEITGKNISGFMTIYSSYADKFRKLFNPIQIASSYTNKIELNKPLLELFLLKKIHQDVSTNSPYIFYESLKCWIDNANNTSAITITVHPTTYSYLTGETEPTSQVGGTKEEWMALVTTAQEKQISFATV